MGHGHDQEAFTVPLKDVLGLFQVSCVFLCLDNTQYRQHGADETLLDGAFLVLLIAELGCGVFLP